MSGYLYNFENDMNIITNSKGQSLGLTTKLAADIFASFESPAFWLSENDLNWIIVNPHLFGEASIWTTVTFKLFIVEFTLSFKLLGFKFSPLDFQAALDLDNPSRYCSSVGYFQEFFDLSVNVE